MRAPVGDVDVAGHVERRGVRDGLHLPAVHDRQSEVDAERAAPQQEGHGDGHQDEGCATLVPYSDTPSGESHRFGIYELGVEICSVLLDEIVDGVMTPMPGSSGKSGLAA